ncbi:hypothetical protein RclHR1_10320006 [Rhizophagus clarus]|uniref:Homeobox protein ESX1 n=1 Tax=Rhizophagus clarus TaxID=94130 RepID=A0A2Z6QSC8_9GLOM|nr:hypothetical protein RclHR1_10320006 [Rhizophagus clarus]GES78107.1 homeobox protein ESX1 [Rhizophagus clarus]
MATSTFDQFSKTTSNNNNGLTSVATQRTSINSLLNPEPNEQQKSFDSSSYSPQTNDSWYDHDSLENQQGQNWRRYSSPNLSPEPSTSNTNNKNGLTINYCDDTTSLQQSSQIDSAVSQSMPTSPVLKHSSSPVSDYNGTNPVDDKVSSSSAPSSRRSSMNRSSVSGQAVNSSSNGNSNMLTPPQTPGIKSPTKANFSFPPSVTTCEQIMPQKVKRKRITQEQLQDLVAMFDQTDTPSYDVREKLAKKLNMTNREVQVWFQNRRAKANRAKANEHSASHQHHRFLHHHSVSTAQAASGHASSINMLPHGNFTFVPMFANGGPSTGGPVRGRSNRRHSYVSPPTNNNQKKVSQEAPLTRPRASTVTGAPMTSMNSHVSHVGSHSIHSAPQQHQQLSQKLTGIPPPIKITSYHHDHPFGHSHHHHPGYAYSVPPSPISPIMPMTPISPTTPTLPPINYMLSNINNLTLPPPVPPIKDLLSSSSADYQQSVYQQTMSSSHNSHQQQQIMLPAPQSGYSGTTMTKATNVNSSSEPSLDLLATAAELVQSEEKEKERLKALTIKIEPQEEIENDKKSWRPWLI